VVAQDAPEQSLQSAQLERVQLENEEFVANQFPYTSGP